MAKLNAEYFSHDTDASLDEKIIYLESLFGDSGYAWFFKMLETLGRSNDFEIEWSELKCGVLARKFNTTQQEFNKFIVAATNPDVRAFVIENGKLYSPGLKARLEKMLDRRRKEAERIAEKRAKYSVGATNKNVDATSTQSKVKESKVKESKEDVEEKFTPSSTKEILSSRKIVIEQWAMNYHVTTERIQDCIMEFADFKYRSKENLKWQNESDLIKNFEFWLNSNAKTKQKSNFNQNGTTGTTNREIFRNG